MNIEQVAELLERRAQECEAKGNKEDARPDQEKRLNVIYGTHIAAHILRAIVKDIRKTQTMEELADVL